MPGLRVPIAKRVADPRYPGSRYACPSAFRLHRTPSWHGRRRALKHRLDRCPPSVSISSSSAIWDRSINSIIGRIIWPFAAGGFANSSLSFFEGMW